MRTFAHIALVFCAFCALCRAAAEEVLFAESFDRGGLEKWEGLGCGWSVEPGVGREGSHALVWRAPAGGGKPRLVRRWMPEYRPGMKVEVAFRAKILEPGGKPPPAHLCDIEWWDLNGKWAGAGGVGYEAVFGDFPPGADGWSVVHYTIPWLRSDVSKSVFEFFPMVEDCGVVAVDDIEIRIVERRAIPLASTSAYRGKSQEGRVSFAAALTFDPKTNPMKSVRCTFSFRGASGAERKVPADEVNYRWARVALDTSDFAIGRNDVRVVLSAADGRILDSRAIAFERLPPDAKMPRVYLDGSGRAIINGRRFFPLGMFWHNKDFRERPDAFERYAKGPFNCLQTYEHDVTPEMLDAFWSRGLYVMPSVNEGFYLLGSMKKRAYNLRKGIETEADARAMLTDYVNRIKGHPAVFAWYTSDEFFPWMAPLYAERAELLRRIDPDHPHYGVGNMVSYVQPLRVGFDVFGPDLYFLCTRGQPDELLAPDRATVWKCPETCEKMVDECGGILHLWPVPQAFARGWDLRRHQQDWRKYRFPTAREFRAQCWQYVAVGANGLLHYAYGQMLYNMEKEEFEVAWKTVCDASAEIRAQIPVLLKDEGPSPRNVPQNARVRTWRDGAADYVLVCNLRPEPLSGIVDVKLGDGSVERLAGDGTATRRDGGLAFSLGTFEHVLVRVPRER